MTPRWLTLALLATIAILSATLLADGYAMRVHAENIWTLSHPVECR